MTRPLLLYFSGAGAGGHEAAMVRTAFPDFHVVAIGYPSWPHLADPQTAMDQLLDQAWRATEAAHEGGPTVIFGYSLGAQIGLAIAHRLGETGRPVELFCALDGKLVSVDKPERRWIRRALGGFGATIARDGLGAARLFLLSRASRLVLRCAGRHLPVAAMRWRARGRLPRLLAASPAFERELTMRLLIAAAIPWMQRLAIAQRPFDRSAMLLRIAVNADFDQRWRTLCPDIEIVTVDGEHLTLLQPAQFERIAAKVTDVARRLGLFAPRR